MKYYFKEILDTDNFYVEYDNFNNIIRITYFKDCHYQDEIILSKDNFLEIVDFINGVENGK